MRIRLFGLAVVVVLSLVVLIAGCAGVPPTPTPGSPGSSGPTPPVVSPSTTPTQATPKEGMTSPDYAVHVFLWGSPAVERDLRLAKEAGFTWIKQMFQWNYIEGNGKGKFGWDEPDRIVKAAEKVGVKILARVDIAPNWARDPSSDLTVSGPPKNAKDFADFLFALASRYRKGSSHGRIHAYQIWNEPNLAREWGGKQPDPKQYVELLKAGYQAIKKADPNALVITAGLSPTTATGAIAMPDIEFIKEMYKAGAKDYFDVLGAHGAGYKAPPEMSPDEVAANPELSNFGEGAAGRVYCFRHVEDVRQVMVEHGDEAKKVAVLEFGWTSDPRPGSFYHWHAVTEEQKAEYIVRAYQYAAKNWRPWIGVMSVIYIANPNWGPQDEQYYWSITNPDGTMRPAYEAIKRMPK